MQGELKQVEVRLRLADGHSGAYSASPMNTPEAARDAMQGILVGMDREYLCVVNVDSHYRPLNYNIVSMGTVREWSVSVANVFKAAILSNANGVILFLNHPSGDVLPTEDDRAVVKKAVWAGELLGINVTDCLVIGGGNGSYYSFTEQGLITDYKGKYQDKLQEKPQERAVWRKKKPRGKAL